MATLFFEGFNLQNTDTSLYLDDRYWTRPININTPQLAFALYGQSTDTTIVGTQGALRISGYRLDSNPPQQATFVQLSGVSGLNSDQIYLSFRVEGLAHNDLFNNSFPFACKLFTLCNGDNESLVFETVRTSGASIQGGNTQWFHANSGLGISIKQSGNEIGLFDLRLGDVSSYRIWDPRVHGFGPYPNTPLTILAANMVNRLVHLEFLIDRTTQIVNFKLDGFDVFNRLIFPYNPNASGNYAFDTINNIKFYNRGIVTNSEGAPVFGINNGALTIDDLVICNNSGYDPKTWIGPKTRIWLLSDNLHGAILGTKQDWTVGAGNQFSAIDSRDGDTSYIFSDTSGSITAAPLKTSGTEMAFYNFNSYFTNGIGGIRLYNDVRKTFLDSSFINVYATGTGLANNNVYSEIGPSYTVDQTSYSIKNSFIFNNPATNTPWTSGSFFINGGNDMQTSGYFGIKKL